MKVLLAEDSRTTRAFLQLSIQSAGHVVITAEDGQEALDLLTRHEFDLILLDVIMPKLNGIEAAQRIREYCDRRDIWIPIVFLTAMSKDDDIVRGIEAGGDDYLVKPVSEAVLNAKLKAMQRIAKMREELAAANAKLRQLSEIDGLTGIANRRRFDFVYLREYRHACRDQQPLSLLLSDIDQFKPYNDRYGHQAGDQCLKQVAKTLEHSIRPGDLVARYGGEEFAVILPDTTAASAMAIGERLRHAVEALSLPHADTNNGLVTLSIGAATLDGDYPKTLAHPGNLIELADRALYAAKHHGRNRVERIDR